MNIDRLRKRIAALVAGVIFMEMLDATVIVTALPQMARSFHTSLISTSAGVSAYLITLAIFIPVSGWMTDRFGPRSIFVLAIAVFTIASALCGVCTVLPAFVLMRVLQGIGGAMMVPVGRLIVLRVTPREHLTEALTLISWPGLSALVIGPALGGFIVTYASWHWIFWINIPIGIVAVTLGYLWIENTQSGERHPFDWWTFMLGGLASASTVFATERLASDPGAWKHLLPVLCGSAACLAGAVAIGRRNPDRSLVPFRSFRLQTFALAAGPASVFRIGISGLPILLTLMFQAAFGFSPFRAGLYLVILFLGDLSMKSMVVRILRQFGYRRVIFGAGLITTFSAAACCLIAPSMSSLLIGAILFVHGALRSLQLSAIYSIAFSEVTAGEMARSNSFLSAVMQLCSGMGIALASLNLRVFTTAFGGGGATPELKAFQMAILISALLTLAPVFASRRLCHDAGATIMQLKVGPVGAVEQ
jgi:MFS family permease